MFNPISTHFLQRKVVLREIIEGHICFLTNKLLFNSITINVNRINIQSLHYFFNNSFKSLDLFQICWFFTRYHALPNALPDALLLFIRQNDALPRVTAIFNNIYIYIYIYIYLYLVTRGNAWFCLIKSSNAFGNAFGNAW